MIAGCNFTARTEGVGMTCKVVDFQKGWVIDGLPHALIHTNVNVHTRTHTPKTTPNKKKK